MIGVTGFVYGRKTEVKQEEGTSYENLPPIDEHLDQVVKSNEGQSEKQHLLGGDESDRKEAYGSFDYSDANWIVRENRQDLGIGDEWSKLDNRKDYEQIVDQDYAIEESSSKKQRKGPKDLFEAVERRNSVSMKNFSGSINHQDSDGNTALHLAAQAGYLLGVKTLIGLDADLSLRNNAGRTLLEETQFAMKNKKLSSGQKNRLYWAGKLLERGAAKTKTGLVQKSSKEKKD